MDDVNMPNKKFPFVKGLVIVLVTLLILTLGVVFFLMFRYDTTVTQNWKGITLSLSSPAHTSESITFTEGVFSVAPYVPIREVRTQNGQIIKQDHTGLRVCTLEEKCGKEPILAYGSSTTAFPYTLHGNTLYLVNPLTKEVQAFSLSNTGKVLPVFSAGQKEFINPTGIAVFTDESHATRIVLGESVPIASSTNTFVKLCVYTKDEKQSLHLLNCIAKTIYADFSLVTLMP